MKRFSKEELASFDGKEGRPAYVAYGGKVYDLSASRLWPNGLHMRRHGAGAELTSELGAAPHGPERLEAYPQVGVLGEEEPAPAPESAAERLLSRFPRLRRHPHPMTVHFPLAFAISAPSFELLHRTTGRSGFGTTAYHCLWALAVSAPVAILTGYLAWKINYLRKPLRPVKIKERLAFVLWGLSLLLLGWRCLDGQASGTAFYLALLCALAPLATALGWFGSQLTFPVEKAR